MEQTRDDAIRALREQVGFLRRSGEAFDAGDESEAKRVAVAIRSLVWDKNKNRSILKFLDVKDSLLLVDTSHAPFPPGAIVKHIGLAMAEMGTDGSRFVAALDGRPRRPPALFDAWWREIILTDNLKNDFSREDLVLGLAHKEGGAHFDSQLEEAYAALARSNSLGWTVHEADGSVRSASPIPANVRQVGWELQISLEEQLPELLN